MEARLALIRQATTSSSPAFLTACLQLWSTPNITSEILFIDADRHRGSNGQGLDRHGSINVHAFQPSSSQYWRDEREDMAACSASQSEASASSSMSQNATNRRRRRRSLDSSDNQPSGLWRISTHQHVFGLFNQRNPSLPPSLAATKSQHRQCTMSLRTSAASSHPRILGSMPSYRAIHNSSRVDVAAGGSELHPDIQQSILEQLLDSPDAEQINSVLKSYDAYFDERLLSVALDAMMNEVKQRKPSSPGAQEAKQRLSVLYMHLLPNMEPVSSVRMLQTLAQLGVCMHEPGRNQEGFTTVNQHMIQVAQVLLRMDSDQDVISMLWALSKHSHHRELAVDKSLFQSLAPYLEVKVPTLKLRHLSKIAQAYANVGISDWSLMDSISKAAYSKLTSNETDAASTSNLLDAFAKLKSQVNAEDVVYQACRRIERFPNQLNPSNLATVFKALGELKHKDNATLQSLIGQAFRWMGKLNASQILSITSSLRQLDVSDIPIHAALSGRAQQILPSFSNSEIGSFVYHLGKQGLEPKQLMPSLVQTAKEKMDSMSLCNVSNLVRGLQLLDYGAQPAPDKQEGEALPDLEIYKLAAQRVKRWLKDSEGRLVLSVEGNKEVYLDEDMRKVERIRDEHSGDTFERTYYKSGNIVESLYNKGAGKRCFILQNLSDIALALADRGVVDLELFGLISARAKETIASSTSLNSLVDLACGFAQAGIYDKGLFDAFESKFSFTFSEMGPMLADMMWSFATVKHPLNEALLKNVMDAAWSRWSYFERDQQVLARLIWSLYALNADLLHPGHNLLLEFQRLLDHQQQEANVASEDAPAEQVGSPTAELKSQ